MVCWNTLRQNQTPVEREIEVAEALKRLELQLAAGQVTVSIGANGAVSLSGWSDSSGLSDVCSVQKLTGQGSWELAQAIASAEMMSGRKVDLCAVAAGWHTHDGGKNWSKH